MVETVVRMVTHEMGFVGYIYFKKWDSWVISIY